MNPQTRLWVGVLAISAVFLLGVAPSAKADVIYTINNPGNFSLSFEVPAIITQDATITQFLNVNIVPGGNFASFPCAGTISTVFIQNAQSSSPFVDVAGPPCQVPVTFTEPINSFGTYNFSGFGFQETLTISPSGVAEPSGLLLLSAGLASVVAMRRKRLPSRQYLLLQEHGKRAIRLV